MNNKKDDKKTETPDELEGPENERVCPQPTSPEVVVPTNNPCNEDKKSEGEQDSDSR